MIHESIVPAHAIRLDHLNILEHEHIYVDVGWLPLVYQLLLIGNSFLVDVVVVVGSLAIFTIHTHHK